jgi:hypothetical protein
MIVGRKLFERQSQVVHLDLQQSKAKVPFKAKLKLFGADSSFNALWQAFSLDEILVYAFGNCF